MLVVDTSAFVSLAIADCHELLQEEFDVHTTERVMAELRDTAAHDDRHGLAAAAVLDRAPSVLVHGVDGPLPETSRIDAGEGSCVVLCRSIEADFLLTDDLRALPELQRLVDAEVAISPIALRALVQRDVLGHDVAMDRLDAIAATRSWLGAPIYERATGLFDET